ncbi:MAG: heme-binding protein [Paracoccaceae bacterium]
MRRIIAIMVAIWAGSMGEAQMSASVYKGTETAPYTVERQLGAAEIRRYDGQLVAEVTVSGDRSAAAGKGFRVLAGFIFGGNDGSAKIAMTTPVGQVPLVGDNIAMTTPVVQMGADTQWVVRFTMPAEYSRTTLPKPRDARIKLVETAPRRLLVMGFSGLPTEAALDKATDALRLVAKAEGIAVTAPEFMFYDSPMTLPWNRRNEVAFTLE